MLRYFEHDVRGKLGTKGAPNAICTTPIIQRRDSYNQKKIELNHLININI